MYIFVYIIYKNYTIIQSAIYKGNLLGANTDTSPEIYKNIRGSAYFYLSNLISFEKSVHKK